MKTKYFFTLLFCCFSFLLLQANPKPDGQLETPSGEVVYDTDLTISDLALKLSSAMAERTAPLIMKISNVGKLAIEDGEYSVRVTANGEFAVYKSFEGLNIEAGESIDIQIDWLPKVGLLGELEIRAVVSLSYPEEDQNTPNDTSNTFIVNLRPFSEKDTANIIADNTMATMPINFGNKGSIVQSLYLAKQIGFYGGIDKITWYYTNTSEQTVKQPIQVYMGSMKEEYLGKAWLSASERQLVFDDSISLEPGMDKEVSITLSRPYIYDRDHLSIIVVKNNENTFEGITFKYSADIPDLQTNYLFSPDKILDIDNSAPNVISGYPLIKIEATTATGIYRGTVDGSKSPYPLIVNAKISLNEVLTPNIQSDAKGKFRQEYIPAGTYTAKVTALGYVDKELKNIVITKNSDKTANFEMDALPKVILAGLVSFDGKPLAGARVNISGYDTREVYTGADGKFNMTGVYGEKFYMLEISKGGTQTYRDTFTLAKVNKEDINVTLVAAPYTPPYVFDFDVEDGFITWQVIDANNDEATWECDLSSKCASYTSHQSNAANDYLVSPSVHFEKGVPYKIHFNLRRKNTSTPEKIRVYYGEKIGTAQDQTLLLEYTLSSKQDTNFAIEFTPTEDGIYKIGFQAASAAVATSGMEIRSFKVVEYYDTDLTISDLALKFSSAMAERTAPLIMKISNVGKLAIEEGEYSVRVTANGEFALSKSFEGLNIEAGESIDIQIDWLPKVGLLGELEIRAVVSLSYPEKDQNTPNDTSNTFIVNLRPFSEKDTANIIADNTMATMPINFGNKGSIVQSLYLAKQIGFYGGIDKITWYYNNTSDKTVKQPIQVYMGSTSAYSLESAWPNASERQLVFDDSISLEPGMDKEVSITLSLPYIYDRDHLSIIVVKNNESTFEGITFKYSADELGFQTNYLVSPGQILDIDNSVPITISGYPLIKIEATTATGIFRGLVEASVKPWPLIVNAKVSLNEVLAPNIQSNAKGIFEQNYIPVGTYTAKLTALGYVDKEVKNISIVKNENKRNAIEMDPLPKLVLAGLVSFDGKPLAGARVNISGYDTREVYTGADGKFSMTGVYGEKFYMLEISKGGTQTYRDTFTLAKVNKEDINVTLVAASYTPRNVVASTTATIANITWENPALTEYRYDGGMRTGQVGFGGNSLDSLYGVMYKGAIILDSISWFLTSEGGPHTEVNVYILDLDASGKPSTKVLFSQMDVPNTDLQWTSFGLPASLECPNGFMVALNYPGFLGIGTDNGSVSGYPFVSGVNYRIDLRTNTFIEYLGNEGNTNLMIRAKGHPYGTPKPAVNSKIKNNTAHISGIEYQVYRLLEKDAAKESAWTLLTPTAISAKTYADNTWGNISDEPYQYAVKAVYATEYSAAVLSNMVQKEMTVQIKIELSANTNAMAADGASVSLVNNNGDTRWVYNGLIKDGKLSFDSLRKGSYTLKIEQPKFAPILKENLDLTRAQTLSYTLEQVIVKPFNLAITATDNQLERSFTWNTNADMVDDVFIGSKAGKSEMLSYEIYLDGAKVADVDTNHYLFSNLTAGKEYTAGVKSKYASGLSEMSTIKFIVKETANDEMQEQIFSVYPNPVQDILYIDGQYERLEIYDLSGRRMMISTDKSNSISVSGLSAGSYVIKIYTQNKMYNHKLIKK